MDYRKVIDAALRIEGGVWGLAAALADEMPLTQNRTRVVAGEWPKVTSALKKAGVTSSNGEPYSQNWLKSLYETEIWVRETCLSRLRDFPLRRVMAARYKASDDGEQALLLLKGSTLHKIAGTKAQPLADALAEASPEEIAKAIPTEKRQEVEEALDQLHPATSTKAPLDLGKEQTYGFALEMGGVSQRLLSAIDAYVEAWEEHAPAATEEERQIERDLLAPKILRLRMTVEEVEVR